MKGNEMFVNTVPVRSILLAIGLFLAALFASGLAQAIELDEKFDATARSGKATVDHTAWDKLLKSYVRAGEDGLNRFDYGGLKQSGMAQIRAYLDKLQGVTPANLTQKEQFAFWVNLYNAKTAEIVADKYPVTSIRDIRLSLNPFSGPWKKEVVKVAGSDLSLDDIEHKILRPVWDYDPRIHYAVNCASIGCPNLATRSFTGERLEAMLDQAARDYVNSPRGVTIKDGNVIVSSLYKWYADDFGKNTAEIINHIATYAKPDLAKKLRASATIDDYEYDWMLNDAK